MTTAVLCLTLHSFRLIGPPGYSLGLTPHEIARSIDVIVPPILPFFQNSKFVLKSVVLDVVIRDSPCPS